MDIRFKVLMLSTLLLLSGCGWLVKPGLDRSVRNQFPPLDISDERNRAVQVAIDELTSIGNPNVLINIPSDRVVEEIKKQLPNFDTGSIEFIETSLSTETQGIRFFAKIRGTTNKPSATFEAELSGWTSIALEQVTIEEVKSFKDAGWLDSNNKLKLPHNPGINDVVISDSNIFRISVRPLFKEAKITRLSLKPWLFFFATKPLKKLVNSLLKDYMDSVNGQIQPFHENFDLGRTGLSGKPTEIDVGGRTVLIPGLVVNHAALLVDELGIHLLGSAGAVAEGVDKKQRAENNFEQYRQAFWDEAQKVKPNFDIKKGGFFVSEDLLDEISRIIFPRVSVDDVRNEGIERANAALAQVNNNVVLGFSFGLGDFQEAIRRTLADVVSELNSGNVILEIPDIRIIEQLIKLSTSGELVDTRSSLKAKFKLEVGGTFYPEADRIIYRLAISSLEITDIEHLGSNINLTPFAATLTQLAQKLILNANALFEKQSVSIDIDALSPLKTSSGNGLSVSPENLMYPDIGELLFIPLMDQNSLKILIAEGNDVVDSYRKEIEVLSCKKLGKACKTRLPSARAINILKERLKYYLNVDPSDYPLHSLIKSIFVNKIEACELVRKRLLNKNINIACNTEGEIERDNFQKSELIVIDQTFSNVLQEKKKEVVEDYLEASEKFRFDSWVSFLQSSYYTDWPYAKVTPVPPVISFEEFKKEFLGKWKKQLPIKDSPIYISMPIRWVQNKLSEAINYNDLKISANFDTGEIWGEPNRINPNLKPGDLVKCSAGRTCARKQCSRSRCSRSDSCDWDCRKCIRIPLDGKACADEPVCKAGELACNVREEANVALCNTREETKLAACKIASEAEYITCEGLRELEELGCATVQLFEKALVDTLNEVGGVGRFQMSTGAKVAGRLDNIKVSPVYGDQFSLDLSLDTFISANVSGKVDFVPYDIGHLLVCLTKGQVRYQAATTTNSRKIKTRINIVESAQQSDKLNKIDLELKFSPISVSERLSPSPVDGILQQNPQIYVTCSPLITGVLEGVSILGDLDVVTNGLISTSIEDITNTQRGEVRKALSALTQGRISDTYEIPPLQMSLDPLVANVSGTEYVMFPKLEDSTISFEYRDKIKRITGVTH